MESCDLLIKNGRVFDPANGVDRVADIAARGGNIAAIGSPIRYAGVKELDASGCVVTPGLVDLHTHLYPYTEIGVLPDAFCLPNGVTSAADAGSAGWGDYERQRYYSCLRKVTVKNFVNCSAVGLSVRGFPDQMNLNLMNGRGKDALRGLFDRYGDELAGIKLMVKSDSMKDYGEEPVAAALEVAEEIGAILMIHISDSTIPLSRLASMVRPGDILTHCYNDTALNILDKDGRVFPQVREAQKRGVVFDVGNARKHFAFSTAATAMAQGFFPDTISTDATILGAYKKPEMCCLPWVMSKFMALGMTFEQVIERCTAAPAKAVDFGGNAGRLTVGKQADIAVLKILDRPTVFTDYTGRSVKGASLIKVVATVKNGELLWRDIEF